jgi:Zn-dependent protease
MIGLLSSNPMLFAAYMLGLVVAVTVHEFCHAYAADQLGDPTPRVQGRVNLNPMRHLDPLGVLFLLFAGFGWGRPVQFDPFNLKNPRRDAALISIAGPASNFVIAALLSIPLRMSTNFELLLAPIIYINIILGVFNFLPVAPLDGFKIVGGVLPEEKAHEWYQLERYGIFFLLMLILPFGGSNMLSFIITPIIRFLLPFFIPESAGSTIF